MSSLVLPEKGMRLSNSKLKTWRRCPNQFRYKYVMGLRRKEKKVHLERGTWLHDLLMHHYDGQDWREHHTLLSKQFYTLFEEEREDLGELPEECGRIMESYMRRYKTEDKQWNVIDSELDEIITLPNGLRFQIIIDLIVEENEGLWVVDHKSVTNFMDPDFMLLDAQLARYFWALEFMGYTPLRGIIFNELRTKPPTIPSLLKERTLKDGTIKGGGLSQAKNIDTDLYTYYREIKRHGLDPKDYKATLARLKSRRDAFFLRTRLPKDKVLTRTLMKELVDGAQEIQAAVKKNRFPRSPDKSCRWGCDFKDICIVELHGGNIDPLIKHQYTVKNQDKD